MGNFKTDFVVIILDYFSSGGEIETSDLDTNTKLKKIKYTKKDQEIVNKINELLEERIKPAVAQDGGDINFVKFKKELFFLNLEVLALDVLAQQ